MNNRLLHEGWTSTYDDYYGSRSKDILDVALNRLSNDPSITFVWAEVIFLQRWYQAISENQKKAFKK